ncbi:MAG: CHASE2 domain-containing protein, partial [Candidatus Electrothrix sp. AR5]|nr:CHASE2 domain-containing protein [Candidatus Electrothrix sp. AR5]
MFSRLRKRWRRCGFSSLSVAGVLLTIFFVFFARCEPPLLHELRLKSFDFFLQYTPAPLSDPRVIIVDVDSESLEELGQWPWPRKRIARLLKKITSAGPTVVGLDMIFAEPDSSSPHLLGALDNIKNAPAVVQEYLQGLPDYDQSLAQALKESPTPVVLGYVFTSSAKNTAQQQRKIPRKGNFVFYGYDPLPFLFPFNGVDSSLEMFERTAQGIGFLNIIPDQDSIIRNIPLVINYKKEIYPSLILSMLQVASSAEGIALETDQNGVRAVQVGERQIPTNMYGELIINFSGPARTLPYVSARDILSGQFDADLFHNAYVLVGTSAPGLFD